MPSSSTKIFAVLQLKERFWLSPWKWESSIPDTTSGEYRSVWQGDVVFRLWVWDPHCGCSCLVDLECDFIALIQHSLSFTALLNPYLLFSKEWPFSSETKYMMVKCEFLGGSDVSLPLLRQRRLGKSGWSLSACLSNAYLAFIQWISIND